MKGFGMGTIGSRQTDGDHYLKMGMHPIQFAQANHYDPCSFSILKYVSRHRDKKGLVDLDKAVDFVDFKVELDALLLHQHLAITTVSPEQYATANSLGEKETGIIRWLHFWAVGAFPKPDFAAGEIKTLIAEIKATYP